jgi:hypothetical protein
MVDSQSLGRENSGRFARQRASQIGFLFLTWVSKPLLNSPSLQTETTRRRGAVPVNAQLLKASYSERNEPSCVRFPTERNYFFVKLRSSAERAHDRQSGA